MNTGRSLRLYLVDGASNGLITAEIMNWTGHALTGPRSKLKELLQRPECARTGVYFLVGPDPKDAQRTCVYIGESDDMSQRLRDHNRPADQGGKDFWERVCLVSSKDQNLTKAHIKHLESLLICLAAETDRCTLANNTAPTYVGLPEADQADMAYFLEQVCIVLPVLGFDFLRKHITPSSLAISTAAPSDISRSPRFILEQRKEGLTAFAQEIDGEFFVLKDSQCRQEWRGVDDGYQSLYNQLVDEGVLLQDALGHRRFKNDYAFRSPSAAAAVVCGRSANGRVSWLVEGIDQTYAAWQDQQVAAAIS